ncbi:MAG: 3-dehydroquinate synthase [Ignavibacteriae bacterium]|nr:3-dehydroquinate synthase [Ignavibacteriota bacterium]
MHEILVELGDRSYPIYVGTHTLSTFPEVYTSHHTQRHVAIITDTNVARLHLRQLANALRHHGFDVLEIVIPPGERQKSLSRVNSIVSTLLESEIPRKAAIIAFGGGVVGDLAGFVAATYRRGVDFIQVPTTFLAQVESAIGGKVAINHPMGKNILGAYYQPKFVFSDVYLLSTLPRRETICGLGELLKYAFLSEEMFCFLEENLDEVLNTNLDILQEIIVRCNMFKVKLISEDEREENPTGGRQILNLGHTIGHALETLSSYKLHHGEAVLVGLRWELHIAREARIIDRNSFAKLEELLRQVPYEPPLKFLRISNLLKALYGKKTKAKFVLPKSIGEIVVSDEIDARLVEPILRNLSKR